MRRRWGRRASHGARSCPIASATSGSWSLRSWPRTAGPRTPPSMTSSSTTRSCPRSRTPSRRWRRMPGSSNRTGVRTSRSAADSGSVTRMRRSPSRRPSPAATWAWNGSPASRSSRAGSSPSTTRSAVGSRTGIRPRTLTLCGRSSPRRWGCRRARSVSSSRMSAAPSGSSSRRSRKSPSSPRPAAGWADP